MTTTSTATVCYKDATAHEICKCNKLESSLPRKVIHLTLYCHSKCNIYCMRCQAVRLSEVEENKVMLSYFWQF